MVMVTVTIVHHDLGKRLDGETNGGRRYQVFCEKLPLCPEFSDESKARIVALRAYDSLCAPKRRVERNDDTGAVTVLHSDLANLLQRA